LVNFIRNDQIPVIKSVYHYDITLYLNLLLLNLLTRYYIALYNIITICYIIFYHIGMGIEYMLDLMTLQKH